MQKKFHFKCLSCGHEIDGFEEWFGNHQKCPKCGGDQVYTEYSTLKENLIDLIHTDKPVKSLWHYFDFLPLNDPNNIVSDGEGVSPIQRWKFMEDFADKYYGLNIEVYVNRNDYSPATGTFKDKGASLAASVLKEHGIKEYVVASTGNTANAFAQYLAKAGISASIFVPQDSLRENFVHIGSLGQKVYVVKGDYAYAKKLAKEYAEKFGILISIGNMDPLRLEAKKTTAFEIIRQLGKMPDVYIQAISGGTSPLAMEKAFHDFESLGILGEMPRMVFIQGDRCDPQVRAWKKAKAAGFPEGWEYDYPVIENPVTLVPTLATGNPVLYPRLARLVKRTGGEYFSVKEEMAVDMSRLVAYEVAVKVGPASAVGLLGFFEALKNGVIRDNESVFINMGEGVRRAISFLEEVSYTTEQVTDIRDLKRFDRNKYRDFVWKPFLEHYTP
ncbi:MAG: pyridoxal-phosphate dependent enzyme [Chlorobi bacterium]|nr:pyridoxal-phosphate dependent enzyme [Chlorobiota bacterium]